MHSHKNKRSFAAYLLIMAVFVLSQPALTLNLQEIKFKLKIVSDIANIRLEPDIGSTVIHQLSKNTIIRSTEKQGDWYHVLLEPEEGNIITGYIHESLVIEVEKYAQAEEIQEQPKDVQKTEKQEQIQDKEKEKPVDTEESPPKEDIQDSQPSEFSPFFSRPHLFLSFGLNYLSGGDINTGISGLVDYYRSILRIPYSGEVQPLHLGYAFCADILFPLNDRFFLGLGADFFISEKENRIEFENQSSSSLLITNPKAQALPIRLSLSYFPVSSLYIKIGGEYLFARCTYLYRYRAGDYFQEWKGESTAKGIGIAGGTGYIQKLNNNISLFVESTGRYAKIKGFTGKNDYKESTGYEFSEEGKLYSYDIQVSGGKSYQVMFIRGKKPSEGGVVNVRPAMIDFSGLTLRAGIKIRF